MYDYEAILASQCLRVERAYSTQIMDPAHPARGAFLSETSGAHPNADHGANASLLASACCVLLADSDRRQRGIDQPGVGGQHLHRQPADAAVQEGGADDSGMRLRI